MLPLDVKITDRLRGQEGVERGLEIGNAAALERAGRLGRRGVFATEGGRYVFAGHGKHIIGRNWGAVGLHHTITAGRYLDRFERRDGPCPITAPIIGN